MHPQVGNFLTDRPSLRVLAAPGGTSQVFFGDAAPEPIKKVVRRLMHALHFFGCKLACFAWH